MFRSSSKKQNVLKGIVDDDEFDSISVNHSEEPKIPVEIFKIIILGDANVGKTEIMKRFCGEPFGDNTDTTIGLDFKVKNIEVDNCVVKLQMWDTAGHERFRTMTKIYYRGSHGVLFVYDISNIASFENICDWVMLFNENSANLCGRHIEKMLVGNKIDKGFERAISKERGMRLAMQYNMRFIETSAVTKENINETFETLAKQMKYRADLDRNNKLIDAIIRPNDTFNIFSDLEKPKSKKCVC